MLRLILIFLISLPNLVNALSMSEDKVPVSGCKDLDSYLYYCKKFDCAMKLPVPNAAATMKMSVLGEQEGKCYYNIFITISTGDELIPLNVATKCMLSQEGKIEAVKEFQSYKKGNIDIYMRSTQNPILKTECLNEQINTSK